MTRSIPDDIQTLAHERSAARAAGDWAEADRLRGLIEGAGWKLVDRGTRTSLSLAHPPDLALDDGVRYGTSASVPSRLEEPASAFATIILVATDRPTDLERSLAALRGYAPAGSQVVIVADAPSAQQTEALSAGGAGQALSGPGDEEAATGRAPADGGGGLLAPIGGIAPEVLWTSQRLGIATALACGLRRAAGEVVVLLDADVEPTGDVIGPIIEGLRDRRVAVVGASGSDTPDLGHYQPAGPGPVDVIETGCLAFRRTDIRARGPLDERFRFSRDLCRWWSLVLRDEGPGRPPRQALALDLPLARQPVDLPPWHIPAEVDRLAKRDRYRVIDRFAGRRDLLRAPAPRRSDAD
jgi:hypothetical protein